MTLTSSDIASYRRFCSLLGSKSGVRLADRALKGDAEAVAKVAASILAMRAEAAK